MKQSVKKNHNEVNTVAYDDVIKYCDDIQTGKIIACEQMKQQVQRFQDDISKGDYYVDENLYNLLIDFFGIIRHYTGVHYGNTFTLLPWQKFIIQNVVCLKNTQTNKNKYREAYIQLARKQGKSFFMQALCMFYLVAMGEGQAEIILAANTTTQQQIIYNMAYRIARQLDPNDSFFRHLRGKKISYDQLFASLQVIAQQSKQLDGLNASMSVVDEYHQQSNTRQYDAITTSMGMRQNPLLIIITTQGFDMESPCYEKYNQQKDVVSGTIEDNSLFVQIFEQDSIEEIEDESTWVKSNPSLNHTVSIDYLSDQYKDYKLYKSKQVSVLTKNFNIWCRSDESYIEDKYLLLSMNEDVQFSDDYITFIGVDLSRTQDLTQVQYLQEQPDKFVQKVMFYYPKYNLKQDDMTQKLIEWNRQGYITFTDSNVTDYDYIVRDIIKFADKYPVDSVMYDAYNSTQWQIDMQEQGFNMKSYSQKMGSFNRPTKEMERMMLSEQIKIEKNPVLLWNFRNVTLKHDPINDNVKPIKTNQDSKIDGVIQLLMALQGHQLQEGFVINSK